MNKEVDLKKKYEFTIDRRVQPYERTIVGVTGKKHVDRTTKKGRNGHFTDEGRYRRAIDAAVRENGG